VQWEWTVGTKDSLNITDIIGFEHMVNMAAVAKNTQPSNKDLILIHSHTAHNFYRKMQ